MAASSRSLKLVSEMKHSIRSNAAGNRSLLQLSLGSSTSDYAKNSKRNVVSIEFHRSEEPTAPIQDVRLSLAPLLLIKKKTSSVVRAELKPARHAKNARTRTTAASHL